MALYPRGGKLSFDCAICRVRWMTVYRLSARGCDEGDGCSAMRSFRPLLGVKMIAAELSWAEVLGFGLSLYLYSFATSFSFALCPPCLHISSIDILSALPHRSASAVAVVPVRKQAPGSGSTRIPETEPP
jgi:hypothetical protein